MSVSVWLASVCSFLKIFQGNSQRPQSCHGKGTQINLFGISLTKNNSDSTKKLSPVKRNSILLLIYFSEAIGFIGHKLSFLLDALYCSV